MGKKAKSSAGKKKAADRKIDRSALPPPPPKPEDEVGSAKPLDKPALPGTGFKVLGEEGYDDGGVADLSLLIDLEDSVQRRKRGENEYFTALKADLLPRATRGPMAKMTRREQKVSLAQLLFSEDDDCEDKGPEQSLSRWAKRQSRAQERRRRQTGRSTDPHYRLPRPSQKMRLDRPNRSTNLPYRAQGSRSLERKATTMEV
mmetsp:Transcript_9015/g.20966  ORF Transcript_9015/g.20966 Transcript_9015/m.20966 type:complete len:202 (-) Transcript_9015:203-808(-)